MKSRRLTTWCIAFGLCVAGGSRIGAQELKDTLQDIDVGDRWTYNDWESAKAAAAKSKKPILALFR